MAELQYGWHAPSFPVDGSNGPQFVDQIMQVLARVEDRYDSVWVDDHFVPWAKWQAVDTPYVECMTTVSFLAGAFRKIRFGTSVLCQSYRNPALAAKMAANLQLFSGGRLIFGIGAGWLESEYHAYGYEFPTPAVRIAQLAEAIEITRKLWRERPASFSGKYYQIQDAYCEPQPDPVPPILIGGGGEQLTLKVVAQHADWWNLPGGTLDNYAHKLDVLRRHCDNVGRDFDTILKTWSAESVAVAESEAEAKRISASSPYQNGPIVGTPEQVADQLRPFVNLGVRYLMLRFVDFPSHQGVELFADAVMPLLKET
jgi:alkanesulfonate monooxygenase SsuD/methylene tetrahydromethanopterin reductase-like flavin-dependent oxidoreductase (luciferase family)